MATLHTYVLYIVINVYHYTMNIRAEALLAIACQLDRACAALFLFPLQCVCNVDLADPCEQILCLVILAAIKVNNLINLVFKCIITA